jgi:hypothetical protein
MSVTLYGDTTHLILTQSGTLSMNNEGTATLSREYQCATSYESTADAALAIDTDVINYALPTGVSNLVCNSSTKTRGNGLTTYSVSYIGITNQVYRTLYGNAILSYSKSVTTDGVTVQYTGTYAAPTVTKYYISSNGGYTPTTPSSGYDTRVLESYANGVAGSAPSFTKAWLLTNLKSTQVGTYYIIEATGTKTITG